MVPALESGEQVHVILTYVLRLLVDRDHPGDLRGSIQQVAELQSHPFVGGQALLALLCQASREAGEPAAPKTGEKAVEADEEDHL